MTTSGAKAVQRTDNEDRSLPFKMWHRTLAPNLYATDLDLVEMRFRDGELIPVAILELTRVDDASRVTARYLDAITTRFYNRDFQARTACRLAEILGCPPYIVLFAADCSVFWVIHLVTTQHSPVEWNQYNPQEMEAWLSRL